MTTLLRPTPAPLWRRVLPHLLALLFFLALASLYFAPILFEDKTLAQHDIVQFNGGAREAALHREATGEEALWTNSMFSGMPTYLISTRFPGDLSIYLHKLFTLDLPAVVANLFLALVCGYALGLALGLSPLLSAVGAVALGFTSYNLIILAAGHNTKSLALAYAPLVLAGLLVTFRRNKWLGMALFTLGLAMNIRSNHLQITYYLLLLVLVFGVVELVFAFKEKRLPEFFTRTAMLAVGALLAAGVSFGRLYTTLEYGQYSIRGRSELTTPPPAAPGQPVSQDPVDEGSGLNREYAFSYSYGIGETATLLIPNFYGGASQMKLSENSATGKALVAAGVPPAQLTDYLAQMPTYWGDQPITSGPVYVGAVVFFLFVLGLMVADRRTRIWLLVGTLLSIMLAWGKNFETFNYLMFDLFPGYNKFRAVSMALVIAQLAMPVLAVLALARVLRGRPGFAPATPAAPISSHPSLAALAGRPLDDTDTTYLKKHVLRALAITAGLCVLAFLVGLVSDFAAPIDAQLQQGGFPLEAIRADRASLLNNDVFRSLLFMALAAGVLWFFLQRKLSAGMAAALVGLLTLVDLWGVDKRYLNDDNFQRETVAEQFVPSAVDEQILQDKDLSYRVLNMANPFNDAQTSYYHKSIGGYHGAKLRRYQDLIERQISPQLQRIYTENRPDAAPVLNMLNTRYLITPPAEKQPAQAIRNPGALGNAWYVSQVQSVQSPDQEIKALTTLDPATTAVVDASKFPGLKASYAAEGSTIALTKYSPNALTYRTTAVQNGLVVFSEIYYADGWQAYLDGKPVPHLRVDYVLRAMPVPAGTHTIEFKFEPTAYALGNTVSLVSSVLLILLLLGAAYYAIRVQPASEQPGELVAG
ncbi:YfhO family protein [Hymenobacter terrestris]|uniref:YfhO family protein n=1 Tax=Hymenobacter terrestris TaxID=2748310 RepID=A0ABX2QAI7_9BACT|nr:YfhO family protein [Hymenobacter terrestris]NVO86742.1 YfhO family protein [Hymenobacter terrestris]